MVATDVGPKSIKPDYAVHPQADKGGDTGVDFGRLHAGILELNSASVKYMPVTAIELQILRNG